jgi:transcriptional regulator with XRE-family HTH domain
MTGRELKEYRKNSRLTQEEAAAALGVSQTYLSLLESDKRRLTERLKKKLVKKMHVRPTKLPAQTKDQKVSNVSDDQLTADLSALGYKGFSHWKPSQLKNPADVLLSALNSDKRDARLVEALPWLLLQFPDMEWRSLVKTARAHLLQNRLGFVTDVARRVAEFKNDRETASKLSKWESELEHSKLEREGTLCNEEMTNAERKWLQTQRPEASKQWHLLTDLSPHNLSY